jgi:hypothetical protein
LTLRAIEGFFSTAPSSPYATVALLDHRSLKLVRGLASACDSTHIGQCYHVFSKEFEIKTDDYYLTKRRFSLPIPDIGYAIARFKKERWPIDLHHSTNAIDVEFVIQLLCFSCLDLLNCTISAEALFGVALVLTGALVPECLRRHYFEV